MAKLGRVIGNTMTNVSPSNLKLIGRATYLIQSHVNDSLKKPGWIKNMDGVNLSVMAKPTLFFLTPLLILKTKKRWLARRPKWPCPSSEFSNPCSRKGE